MSNGWNQSFDREIFLARHWQRKPLLIRAALDNFSPPLDRHELAGLALEEGVESRIIEHRDGLWQLHHGPFSEQDFQRDFPWTLLVQAVDHHIPEVSALRRLVDFLPQWRMDDVMASYAVDGGSVGPHYDNYDVFLLQGEGERLWKLGQFCDAASTLLPHDELRILDTFECEQEYLLGPGDMLYVPPGIAHWGIAQGECTTFSIGFRAPRINDMVSRWGRPIAGATGQ
jgi:50S ribosomal protein L16 3-hydroxylase